MEEIDLQIKEFQESFNKAAQSIAKIIVGYKDIIENILISIFAGGHILLEGVPGLGKTLLAETISKVFSLSYKRIQCTPDLMPADIIGTYILYSNDSKNSNIIKLEKGPIFSNLVLADEINRATPRTQSAFLEAMQENKVTIRDKTYNLPQPFIVIGTQNPIEMEGTYPLPEAQLDRFFFKLIVHYPTLTDLIEIGKRTTSLKLPEITSQFDTNLLQKMRKLVRNVCIADSIIEYIGKIVLSTHPNTKYSFELVNKYVSHGVSPRGFQTLILASKVKALLKGRLHVAKEDIKDIILPAFQHRIILNFEGKAENIQIKEIINKIYEKIL